MIPVEAVDHSFSLGLFKSIHCWKAGPAGAPFVGSGKGNCRKRGYERLSMWARLESMVLKSFHQIPYFHSTLQFPFESFVSLSISIS